MNLRGMFQQYVFRDEKTGFAIIRVKMMKDHPCNKKGCIPEYIVCSSNRCSVPDTMTSGESILMKGEFDTTRKLGFPFEGEKSFVFTEIDEIAPPDEASAIDYISGLGIRGIKEGVAERIVSVTGPDVTSYFDCNPNAQEFLQKLPRFPVIPLASIDNMIRRINSTGAQKAFSDKLAKFGFNYKEAYRLYHKIRNVKKTEMNEDQVLDCLRPQPFNDESVWSCYDFCADATIPFEAADSLAASLGYRAYDPARRFSLVKNVMEQMTSRGNSWTSIDDLYKSVKNTIKHSSFPDVVIAKLALYSTILNNPKYFVCEDSGARIYLTQSWRDEHIITTFIRKIKYSVKPLNYDEKIVNLIENESGITFSASQRRCFGFLRTSGVKIITGNAGTGKTTVISGLLAAYTSMNPGCSVALCAPTGRAAQRMTELCKNYGTNVQAFTIHKLLGFNAFDGNLTTEFNERNPLPSDLILVDEMSMVDAHMFSLLMRAIKKEALVLLCGDVDQLPSVQCGQVFYDLINSKKFETVRLDVNYRQSGKYNNIVENANIINNGIVDPRESNSFRLIRCRTEEEIQNMVLSIVEKDSQATVLSTVHAGCAGVDKLNKMLQPLRNPNSQKVAEYGDMVLCTGDAILMNHNNYKTGYVNGDIGIIRSGCYDKLTVQFGEETKVIPRSDFHDISLAYAMTIHKSQGSEYSSVVIVLPSLYQSMLARNLLYTAVTRAKQNIVVVSQDAAFECAVKKSTRGSRRTTLKDLLIKEIA